MTDLLTRLSEARPIDADLRERWSPEEQAQLLDRIQAQGTRSRRPARRPVLLLAAAAVTAIALIPTVTSGGDAHAREGLLQLAAVASATDGIPLSPGTYLHVKTESVQSNNRVFGDGESYDTDRESWVRWDGAQWAVDTRPSEGWTEYQYFPPRTTDVGFGTPTPEFVAGLPDRPAELREYLDATVSGSNSHNEALFVAVTDLAASHLLDPATFAVALEVLADVDGVQTEDVSVEGRDAVEISYRRFHLDLVGVHSLTIDKATAQVLEVSSSSPGGTDTSTTTLLDAVDSIPSDVLEAVESYGNTRICADGLEAVDGEDC